MIVRIYHWYVGRHRDYKFKNYLARYEQKRQDSRGNTIIWGHPTAIFGYFMGRNIGRNIRRESPHSGLIDRLVQPFHGVAGFLAMFLIGCLLYGIALDFISDDGALAFGVLLFSATPIVHSHYLARQDLSKVKRLRNATNQNLPAVTEQAYQLLDHRQYAVRAEAIRVLRESFEQSPGKAVKHLSAHPPQIRDTLLDKLDTDDPGVTEHALVCLKWFSRDLGNLLIEKGGEISVYLDSNDSTLQAHSAITIGNIGGRDPDRTTEYTRVLTDAVKDQDAEVRHAAAVALGNLPCKRAAGMLEYLTEDPDPDVRQQANQCLQQVLSAPK